MKIFLLLSLVIFSFSLNAAMPFKKVPPTLQTPVSYLYRFPETKTLLTSFRKEIALQWRPLGADYARALWDGGSRTIFLNSSKSWTHGKIICSILLELHNAQTTTKLAEFDNLARRKRLSRRDYIIAIEKLEHENALKTSSLLQRGIELGIFPSDAHYPIYKDFKTHFDFQMRMGHSAIIAKHFDEIT